MPARAKQPSLLTRRDVLKRATLGFGSLAMMDLLTRTQAVAGSGRSAAGASAPHFPARAKRVIYIFLDGGLSQVDSYDYKPRLSQDDGKPLPASIAKPPKVVTSRACIAARRLAERTGLCPTSR